jgi:superfamily II DNA or RNA helicase
VICLSSEGKISGKYFSDQVNVVDKLYTPCLKWATKYVRDAGYFSSHVYQAMSKQILDFVLRDENNHITLITCIDIYPSDFDAIVASHSKSKEEVFKELQAMLEDEVLADPVKMLAAIVASKQMTVYVSLRKREEGTPHSIDHSKSGCFSDGTKVVAFDGSINETYPAVVPGLDKGNKEHFNIYSKEEISESAWNMYAAPIKKRLDDDCCGLFPKQAAKGTIIVEINSISRRQLPSISNEDWNPQSHKERAAKRSAVLYQKFEEKLTPTSEKTANNDGIELRPHQKAGLERWKGNGFRGILQHATGSGKTITALTAIKEHSDLGLPVVVLVPSRLLLEQWKQEIANFIPDASILPVGSGYIKWRKLLRTWTKSEQIEDKKRIVIAINASARTERFMKEISDLKNILLVVDECHRIGATSFGDICLWKPSKVLGLSATPERYDDGAQRMEILCGQVIHEYNLDDAITDKYLTEYIYNIESVSLTDTEKVEYDSIKYEISAAIRKFRDKNGNINFQKLPFGLKLKLIQAKRIIKKAVEKVGMCGTIIEDNYVPNKNQNWLVYCEDGDQLTDIRNELEKRSITPLYEYWSKAAGAVFGPQDDPQELGFDRDGTINAWERTGGVMLSIKCLDEGVNIPSISHGIILASSNNPREFIQRRGRMLRLSKGKHFAHIWDTLVIPEPDSGEYNNYILGEVKRSDIFARNATSGNASLKLIKIKSEYGIRDNIDAFDEEEGGLDGKEK